MKFAVYVLLAVCCFSSCAVQKKFDPQKKYSPAELQQDYELFRNILQEAHPSLYWYTPKDSIDFYFSSTEEKLKDSLTETRFRYLLNYVTSKFRCGHTAVMPSKAASRYAERTRSFAFPLSVKAWETR
jgi:hypothetical protein